MRARLAIVGLLLVLATAAAAQNPVSIQQVGTTPVSTAVPVSGTVTVSQGTAANLNATVVGTGTFTVQAVESGNWLIQGMAAHDVAVTGNPLLFGGYASAAAPTDVGADGRAVRAWFLRNGSPVANLAAGGTLITATSSSLNVNCTGGCSAAATATTNTATQTTGPQIFGNASAATPTAVGADGRSIAFWTDTVGRLRVDLSTVQGTAIDVNSGNKSAGTIRVVLATDQPALTNKLLVTPDSVALPANQSVNVSQINAVTPLMGNGVTGTGSPRVTIASDNTAFAVNNTQQGTAAQNVTQFGGTNVSTGTGAGGAGIPRVTISNDSSLAANQSVNEAQINGVAVTMGAGATGTGVQRVNDVASSATGAAPPAAAQFVGGLGSGATGGFVVPITVCDSSKPITITSATTTLMVTGVAGRQVRICALSMVTAIANNVAVIEGTGATCGTGTAGVMGGTTAANGFNFAANGGLTLGAGLGEVATTATTGDSVCIITSAAGPLAGFIKYAIY